jgi:signal transduction histidine kinase
MKKFSRHGLIALIVSSLILLVVFQVLWLRKVYDEQVAILRKDIDHSFRTVVLALQDSLIECSFQEQTHVPLDSLALPRPLLDNKAILPYKGIGLGLTGDSKTIQQLEIKAKDTVQSYVLRDTLRKNTISFVRQNGTKITISSDSLNSPELAKLLARRFLSRPHPPHPDSLMQILPFGGNARFDTAIGIFISNHKDNRGAATGGHFSFSTKLNAQLELNSDRPSRAETSVKRPISPSNKILASQNLVIKLDLDSLRIDEISAAFKKALAGLGIPLPFRIMRLHQSQLPPPQYQGLATMPVFAGIPKYNVYMAQIPEYQAFVFRRILPQLLFSLALLGITATAFGLAYRSLRQQEKLTQIKNDFINNITHELKTPIATVSVAIEALQSFDALKNPTLTQEYLGISKNELTRLSMLVDKVLKISLFEQKELELKPSSVDVADLIAQVMDSMRLQFEKLGVKTSFDTEGVENARIQADQTHLTSVIYNLLDNALKYGGKQITVSLKNQVHYLEISIADDGCGIAPEHKDKIFEKFFRVPTGDVHNVKGYGLGLSYVASVVKQHHGRMELISELGKGSCFKLYLPYERLK